LGINIQNKDDMRYDTILGYVKDAFELFRLRNLPDPFDFDDRSSLAATILRNIRDEENIADQRSPITPEMFAEMLKTSASSNFLSAQCTMTDLAILGRYLGPRLAEYGQKSQKRPEYHTYPSGKSVLKAWSQNDIILYDQDNQRITPESLEGIDKPTRASITFRIQKNRRNGEVKQVLFDPNNKEMCPVRAAYRIVYRAMSLQQPCDLPVCVYRNKKSELIYLTGAVMSKFLRQMAKKAHPTMTELDLKRYSSHSIRVTAAVLLHEHGCNGDYIKIQLRWQGDSYRVYLRSTKTILKHHTTALNNSAALSIKLANIEQNVSHSAEQISLEEMGCYDDIE
jgi:hypothetical protein